MISFFGDIVGGRPRPLLFCLCCCFVGFSAAFLHTVGDHRGGLVRVDKDVEKVFGAVVPVVLDSALEEFAFVTESMQEAEFEKCREQIVGFVKKIRIKD